MPAVRNIADLMNAVVADAPRGKFHETLTRRALPLSTIIFKRCRKKRDASYTMEQRIRIKPASSARFVRPYEGFGASIDNYTCKISADYAVIADKMPFNEIEDKINSGTSATKIINLYDVRRSAFYEGMWNLVETSLAREPNSSSELDKAFMGLPYWFRRRSTADTRGGFNGITINYLDGTTSTVIGSGGGTGSATSGAVDANTPGNAAVRNWNATYSGTFDLLCYKTLRRALRRTQFSRLEGLKGEMGQQGIQYVLMPEDQMEQYEDLVNAGPDDNNGDLTKHSKIKLDGTTPMGVPELNNLSYAPIYFFKGGHINGNILDGDFMKEHPAIIDPNDPFTAFVTISAKAQLEVENPRHAGGVITAV